MNYINYRKYFIWIYTFFFILVLSYNINANIFVGSNGRILVENSGEISIQGSCTNNGIFTSNNGTVCFWGTSPDFFNGLGTNTLDDLILDKLAGAELTLDNTLTINGTLTLKNGFLGNGSEQGSFNGNPGKRIKFTRPLFGGINDKSIFTSSRTGKFAPERADTFSTETPLSKRIKYINQRASSEISTLRNTKYLSDPLNRLGTLIFGNEAAIIRENGSLTFIPTFGDSIDLFYNVAVTTGYEIPSATSILQNMTINISSGTITLSQDATVNDTLKILEGSLNTDTYTMTMGTSAVVDAEPDDINGNLVGEPYYVGTGAYTNSELGVSLSAGNNIGNFSVLLFIRSVTIGSNEGILRRWRLDSDIPPSGRDMTILWSSDADNGKDLSNLQVFRSPNEGLTWYHIGGPVDISGAGDPRSIVISDLDSFSDWTVDEPEFSISPETIDFGTVAVNAILTEQFTITNESTSIIYGYINTPTCYTIEEATDEVMRRNSNRRNVNENNPEIKRSARKGDIEPDVYRDDNESRNLIYYNITAGSDKTFNLTFSPTSNTQYNGNVYIRRYNSTGNPSKYLPVTGTGTYPPDIDIVPDSLYATLYQDSTATQSLNIANNGEIDLVYSASVFYPGGDRDQLIVSPQGSDYWTGTCTSSAKTDASEVRGYNIEDGWMKFDISSIPDAAIITSVEFHGYVNDTYYPYWSITPVSNDPVITGAEILHADIVAEAYYGYYLYRYESGSYSTGWKGHTLVGTAATDIQISLSQDWFAIGIVSRISSTMRYINFDGWHQSHPPYLVVNYTLSSSYSWLSLDGGASVNGTVISGTPDNISVGFDASGLTDDTYTADIIVTSNDPDESTNNIPITLNVSTPGISVSTTNIDFGNVEVGQDSTVQFYLENTGTATLDGTITTPTAYSVAEVTDERTDNRRNIRRPERFETDSRNVLSYSIPGSSTTYFNLTFTPPSATTYSGNVVITHNAPGDDETIAVNGNGITTPDPPSNVTISVSGSDIILTWDVVPYANSYKIYRSTNPYETNWGTPIYIVGTPSFEDTGAASGTKYFYYITADTDDVPVDIMK